MVVSSIMASLREQRLPGAQASLLLAGLVCGFSAASPASAIQGGASARAGDPVGRATAGIGIINTPGGVPRFSRCTGVLINSSQVLTAAHCVGGEPLGIVVVFYRGSTPVKPVYTARVIARYAPNRGPLTNEDAPTNLAELSGDLAVLQLSAPVRDRAPVPLASDTRRVPSSLQIAGIGVSGRTGGRLRTTNLRTLAASGTGLTLAQAQNSQVCYGDSGGPVVARDRRGVYVWGVASAVVARNPPCGNLLVVAPAAQVFSPGR